MIVMIVFLLNQMEYNLFKNVYISMNFEPNAILFGTYIFGLKVGREETPQI